MIILVFALFSQCSNSKFEEPIVKQKQKSKKQLDDTLSVHSALPISVKSPNNNFLSDSKIELGRLLFYDPILSGDKDIACATCHHPSQGYSEYRDLSVGTNGKGLGSKRAFNKPNEIPLMKRNAHTILNTAFNGINTKEFYSPEKAPMFWDSRVFSLEKQALEPILAFEEMRGLHYSKAEIMDSILQRLMNIPEYVALFDDAFNESKPINALNLSKSIAAFERTLITTQSRFDKYIRGDENAISLSEKDGFKMFKDVGCAKCHNGPMFSDFKPHILGVPKNQKLSGFDKGINNEYAFRTPSLRNLRFTAPYMHNGKFNSLEEVLEFYEDISKGRNRHEAVGEQDIDPLIQELTLSIKEIRPIISFLNTLNDSNFDKKVPSLVPSGLPVGGNIN
jgi:cytochrome c peroxidase